MTMVPTANSDVPSRVNLEARDMAEGESIWGRFATSSTLQVPMSIETRDKREWR